MEGTYLKNHLDEDYYLASDPDKGNHILKLEGGKILEDRVLPYVFGPNAIQMRLRQASSSLREA